MAMITGQNSQKWGPGSQALKEQIGFRRQVEHWWVVGTAGLVWSVFPFFCLYSLRKHEEHIENLSFGIFLLLETSVVFQILLSSLIG